ncbi:MAG TPA: hypothetical protein VEI02_10885 [Planctomycetota bacterium]|nr:hypothetical protein [Planctomycetota bacterium]
MQRCTHSRGVWLVVGALSLTAGCSSSKSEEAPATPPVDAGATPAATAAPQDPAATPTPQDVAERQRQIDAKRRELSNAAVRTGRELAAQGRLAEARQEFLNAYSLDVTNRDAQLELDRMNVLLGRETTGATPQARDEWGGRLAKQDAAMVEARHHMSLGRQARAEGDHARAVEHFSKAYTILKANPSFDADFNEASVRAALDQARADQQAAERDERRANAQRAADVERQREEAERARVRRMVDETYRQAVDQFRREKFADAQRLADEVIRLDYQHAQAKRLKEEARQAEIDQRRAENIAAHREQWQRFIEEVTEARIPLTDDVTYPSLDKWKQISDRGPIELSPEDLRPSELDEDVRRRLAGTVLRSVDWTDKPLADAIKFIRNTAGVNIVVDAAVNEKVPEADRILSLTFDQISAESALKLAAESLKLNYIVDGGLVRITTPEEMAKVKTTNFYFVGDLTGRIMNYPGTELNLNPSGSAPNLGVPEEDTEENRPLEADKVIDIVKNAVDKASWDDGSGNSIVDKNGTLVVKQTAANHRAIKSVLADLRKTTGLQVMIESRFISVENNFLQDIGVDFRGLGDNSGGVGLPGPGTSAPFDDNGLPGTSSPLGSDNSAGFFYSRGADGDIRGRAENVFNSALGNPDTLTSSGGFSLQFAYLDDTQVEAILRAVQKYERVNTVTAPKLVVSNTQRAHLQVINHIAYVKDFDVEIAQAAVIADPVVDVIKEGVILDVRPTVSNDRRFVTLELRPTVATVQRPIRTFTTTLGVGAAVTFEVPELKKESIKTTVVMPDGATLLLGGMKFYEEQDYNSGIPVLKDIPILSFLFSRNGKYTSLRDLIVLLKVRIIIANELEPGSPSNV